MIRPICNHDFCQTLGYRIHETAVKNQVFVMNFTCPICPIPYDSCALYEFYANALVQAGRIAVCLASLSKKHARNG